MTDTDDLNQELSKESDEESDEESEAKGDSRRGRVMMRAQVYRAGVLINLISDWSASSSPQNCSHHSLTQGPTISTMQPSDLQMKYIFTFRTFR